MPFRHLGLTNNFIAFHPSPVFSELSGKDNNGEESWWSLLTNTHNVDSNTRAVPNDPSTIKDPLCDALKSGKKIYLMKTCPIVTLT